MAPTAKWIGGALLVAAGAGLGWSMHTLRSTDSGTDADEAGDGEAADPDVLPEDMCVRVDAAEVQRGELPIVVAAAGLVRAAPAAERALSTRAGGRVVQTLIAPGASVHAGDVLLSLDPLPLQGALAQARAALAQATEALAEFDKSGRARQQLELQAAAQRAASQQDLLTAQAARIEGLHAEGLSSDKALAEARQAADLARTDRELAERAAADFHDFRADMLRATLLATRDGAQAGVDEAARQLAEADVRAPADGQVLGFRARAGMRLDPGETFGELLAAQGRLTAFAVTPAAAQELQPGARACWTNALGHEVTGTLQSLGGDVDPATGMVQALVAPDAGQNPDPPGLAVRGELELRRLADALLVPERAVLRARDQQVVVVADAGHARVVSVKVVGRHAGLAAIAGDVHAGERVIVEGGYNLPDGARIVESDAPRP